jgi:hypothetical protein
MQNAFLCESFSELQQDFVVIVAVGWHGSQLVSALYGNGGSKPREKRVGSS